MQLTPSELSLLRSQPHKTNLWLSIYRPRTTMTARVMTGTYNIGDREITYYGASGTYTNLYQDQTVLVGSQAGLGDVGRIRLRYFTGTYVGVAENSIQWETGQYLTFLDYVTVEAVYPRIIQDPNNEENVIFYKDYDIPYTNQNTIYGAFPCAGPHRAGFILSGTASFYFSATGTVHVGGQSMSYSWNFDGGTPTGSSSLTPGWVTWNSTGHYKARLRVTAPNGSIDDTYRYISIYDRPENGTNVPTLKWDLQELSGSRDAGGYTASFKLYENIGEVEPNALVVIFSEDWYGGTKQSIGGNSENNSSIVFSGYILSDSIKFDYRQSSVEFDVGSVSEVMKNAEGFSVSCESKASPTTWFELQEMTVPRAMYHYLRWHSTVLKVTDFQYTGDDRLVQYFDADRGSLYDAVDSFMRDGMIGALVADRQGKLWAEINSYGLETPFSTLLRRFTVHKQDWINSPTIRERRNSELSFIELGGIAFYGVSSNAFSALLSNAPSTVPLYHGKSERNDGLILVSQQQLNRVAGNYLAHFNSKFPDVTMSMAGNYRNFDIAPLELVDFVIDQNDTVRAKSIQDLKYYVNNMEWNYDSEQESFRPEITFNQVATGTIGVTVEIPAVPPDGGYGYPKIELPPLPNFGASNPVGSTINTAVIFHDASYGFIYSENFDSGSPNYRTVNAGLTSTQYMGANFMFVTPNGAFYVGKCSSMGPAQRGTNYVNAPWIARAPYVGGTFTIIEDENTLWSKYPTYPLEGHAIKACSYDPAYSELVAYVMGESTSTLDVSDFNLWIGASTSFVKKGAVTRISYNHGQCGLSFGDSEWVYTGAKAALFNPAATWRWNSAGSFTSGDGEEFGDISEASHLRGAGAKIYSLGYSAGYIRKSTNNGRTWSLSSSAILNSGVGLSVEPSGGMNFMLEYDTAKKGRSSDDLATVTGLPTLPPGGAYIFAYAGGTGTTSKWIAAKGVIRLSTDFGGTWLNREGDYLTVITPVPNINMIFVPGISQTHAQNPF